MNLPNKLTVLRICLIPFVMFFYLASFIPYGIGKIVALVIFVVAALTDMLDGKIERKHNLVTNLGKFLDPIADKILTSSVLFMIIADGTIPAPWGVIVVSIIIAREFIVTGLRTVAMSKGVVIAASMTGKIKTCIQIGAVICVFLFGYNSPYGENLVFDMLGNRYSLGFIAMFIATVFTIYSGVEYLAKNKKLLEDH